jgi:hypothetical protein
VCHSIQFREDRLDHFSHGRTANNGTAGIL